MLEQTRRRALGLMIGALASTHLLSLSPRARAQDDTMEESEDSGADGGDETPEKPDCVDSKSIGAWTAQASDVRAGATQNEVPTLNPDGCGLVLEFQVSSDFDARIYVEGSPDGTPLPDALVRNPESRLIAKDARGATVVDEPLCGNCTDIYEDTLSLVLPLATAPLLRDEDSMEIALRLAGRDEDCRFAIDCVTMRQALDWASERRDTLIEERDDNLCTSLEGCFVTTACCAVLGLGDDCFELTALRRYRDEVLAKRPNGKAEIARYYTLAPRILARLRASPAPADRVLLAVYARFVLPAALAARFGFDALAYRLYRRMLTALARTV